MSDDLVTSLLPVLGNSRDIGFNVFDVMHHGMHEKQISSVFRWLLDANGTHNLGERFTRVFIDELNRHLAGKPLPHDSYWVRQEVNTSGPGDGADIADLVLESRTTVVVVENYFTSDGHGHGYDRCLKYSQRDGRRGVVALLCAAEDRSLQTLGWENAPVLMYARLVDRLHEAVAADSTYQRRNPESFLFIEHMYRKFAKRRGQMQDQDVLRLVVAMCDAGRRSATVNTRRMSLRNSSPMIWPNGHGTVSPKAASFSGRSRHG